MTQRTPIWIVLAHLLRPQGRKGEVLAELFTDFPERFEGPKRVFLAAPGFDGEANDARSAEVEAFWLPVGKNEGRIVLQFAGIDTISDAELIAGMDVLVPREERRPDCAGALRRQLRCVDAWRATHHRDSARRRGHARGAASRPAGGLQPGNALGVDEMRWIGRGPLRSALLRVGVSRPFAKSAKGRSTEDFGLQGRCISGDKSTPGLGRLRTKRRRSCRSALSVRPTPPRQTRIPARQPRRAPASPSSPGRRNPRGSAASRRR